MQHLNNAILVVVVVVVGVFFLFVSSRHFSKYEKPFSPLISSYLLPPPPPPSVQIADSKQAESKREWERMTTKMERMREKERNEKISHDRKGIIRILVVLCCNVFCVHSFTIHSNWWYSPYTSIHIIKTTKIERWKERTKERKIHDKYFFVVVKRWKPHSQHIEIPTKERKIRNDEEENVATDKEIH